MSENILKLFKNLKCRKHQDDNIVQVCVSTRCTQPNKLCCLECVDEHHCGQDHILISQKKFAVLLQQFHIVYQEKELIVKELTIKTQAQRTRLSEKINKYHALIKECLNKENQVSSYEQVHKIDFDKAQEQQVIGKINDLVVNHSWMLEMNINSLKGQKLSESTSEGQTKKILNQATKTLKSKYEKLEQKLEIINETAQKQIEAILQKRQSQIKKIFHLFDELKYKLDNAGEELIKNERKSNQNIKIESFPSKEQLEERKKKAYYEYLDDLCN